tara:strand:+ start:144 stop:812 length:669 start_codon:yes stop_codon:yes gene_type:complete
MDVYFIFFAKSQFRYLEFPIEKIGLEMKNIVSLGEGTKNMARCPSFRDFYKNTFVYRSPIDFSIDRDKNTDDITVSFPSQNGEPETQLVNLMEGVVEIMPLDGFFVLSNKNLEMDILPPTLSNFIPNVSATFNVGKWTRSIHPAIIPEKGKLTVSRGDALFYIRFRTHEKIKHKTVHIDDQFDEMLKPVTMVRRFVKNKPLQFFYDIFEKHQLRTKIIKSLN